MIRKALGLMAFGGAIVLVACSDETPTEKYPSSDSFCGAKATEECKGTAQLCSVADTACQTKRKEACNGEAGTSTSQGRTYRSTLAETCISKTTAVYADKVLDPAKEAAFKSACGKVFSGIKKANEACASTFDCEGDLYCDPIYKLCSTKNDVQEGKPCGNPGDTCVKGLYCQQQGAVKFCVKKNALGDTCKLPSANDPGAPCLEDLRCNATSCVAKQEVPDPCDTDDECKSGLCDAKKCRSRLFPSETGTCKDFGGS